MNRFLTLSTAVHIGLVAGVLYIGAKNDFSPHKVIESMNFEAFGGEGGGQQAEMKITEEMPEAVQAETNSAPITTAAVTNAKEAVAAKAAVAKPSPKIVEKAESKAIAKSPIAKAKPAQKMAKQAVKVDDSADPEMDDAIVEEAVAEVKAAHTAKPVEKQESIKAEKFETAKEESQEEIQNNLEAVTAAQEQEEQKIADEKAAKDAEHAKKVAYLAQLKKQNAEREASEAAAAAQAAAASAKASEGSSSGLGAKNEGEGPQPGETVHALTEFKQLGGNPKPQYSQEDRMNNRAGVVTFQAFVNKDGSLNEFQLVESSGHRSLDAKTLSAIKKWKFAAGQEGWIEIPFQWDLKGGAQEISPLRRSAVK